MDRNGVKQKQINGAQLVGGVDHVLNREWGVGDKWMDLVLEYLANLIVTFGS